MCDVRRQKAWAEEALKLVAAAPSVLNKRNYKYMTPLMLACATGFREQEKASTITVCFENIVRTYVVLLKRTNVRTCARVYSVRTHVSTYIRIYGTYVRVYVFIRMYVRTNFCAYVRTCVRTVDTHVYICTFVRTHVHMYVRTYLRTS